MPATAPRWRWLPGAARYYDFTTHHFVAAAKVRAWGWEAISASRDRATTAAEMVADGRLSTASWELMQRRLIKDEYIRQYVLGKGGLGQMTQADWGSVGGMVAEQYKWLDSFAKEISVGDMPLGSIAARARMYLNSAQEAFWRATERATGMPPLPAYPGDGSSKCLTNDRCYWDIKPVGKAGSVTGWKCFWRLRPAEHCTSGEMVTSHDGSQIPHGCLERAARWQPLLLWLPGHAPGTARKALAADGKGGPGSGNFNHAGRPGQIGGSAPGTSQPAGTAFTTPDVKLLIRYGAGRLMPPQFAEFTRALTGGQVTPQAQAFWQGKATEWLEWLQEDPTLVEAGEIGTTNREIVAGLDDAYKGGPGSGNFGHAGRPGLVGGSAPATSVPAPTIANGPTAFLVKLELEEAQLPDSHTDGLGEIGFTENAYIGYRRGDGSIGEAYGDYDPRTHKIRLASNAPGGGNIGVYGGKTILHEIGHHVSCSKITDDAAARWQAYSGNGEHARISAYARTNRGEHFAECYRAYTSGDDKRRALKNLEPLAYAFMRRLMRANSPDLLPIGVFADLNTWQTRYTD